MKICPFCGAEIHEQAVMCVHCYATLEQPPTVSVKSDVNLCPNCGNECIKEAIVCVKCGQSLEKKPQPKNNSVAGDKKSSNAGKVVAIIAIILGLVGIIGNVANLISSITYSFDAATVIFNLIYLAGSALVFAGFIIRKNSILPAHGYIVSAIGMLISLIIYIEYYSVISIILVIVSIAQNVILASLFFNKKPNGRNIWLVPVGISVAMMIVNIIINIVSEAYTNGYYYSYFDWSYFISDILIRIGTVCGVLIASANAKFNWYTNDEANSALVLEWYDDVL